MSTYKSRIEGDFIVLYDESHSMQDIKISEHGLTSLTTEGKNKKAKYHEDRVNNLYKQFDKVKNKILNREIT